jgi:hypothetical protein
MISVTEWEPVVATLYPPSPQLQSPRCRSRLPVHANEIIVRSVFASTNLSPTTPKTTPQSLSRRINMKLLYLIFCAALVALGAGEIIAPDSLANETFAKGTRHATFDDHISTRFVDLAAVWFKAVCNGQKLFQAMTTPADTAARFITSVHSSFDGTLTRELRDWGYNEDVSFLDAEKCDFDDVKRAFDDMQTGIRSQSRGGPNQCFQVNHYDGPTVLPSPDGQRPAIDSQRYPGPDGVIRRVCQDG